MVEGNIATRVSRGPERTSDTTHRLRKRQVIVPNLEEILALKPTTAIGAGSELDYRVQRSLGYLTDML